MRYAIALLAAVSFAVPTVAEPLKPTGKWHLFYQESSCVAERGFGDYMLGFQPAPLGLTTRYVIQGPGRIDRARQFDSLIELSDGGPPIKASSLVFPYSKMGRRGMTTVLPNADAARVANSDWIRISTLGLGPKSRRTSAGAKEVMSAEFRVGSTAALAKELAKCMNDLRKHWGMVDGKLPTPANLAQAKGDVRGIFRSSDYPEDAFAANQTGSARFLLMIDEKGDVADCVVAESSGVATLDAMGCQVILERAKFKPALDENGKPTRDTYFTPPIRWMLR